MTPPRVKSTQPTMKDVAREAGVSLKTVSRVINAEPGVTPATLKKVEDVIVALRYQRNDLAANLRSGVKSNTIGLVIEDVANPFYAHIVQAAEDIAEAHSSLLIVTSGREDPERERALIMALLRRRVDGLLIVPAGRDHRYIAAAGFTGHTVFMDRPATGTDADTVLIDNAAGAREAVKHMLNHGHRRIAIVGDDALIYTAAERLRGYSEALTEAGLELSPDLVSMGQSKSEMAAAAVGALMQLPAGKRPTAILAANNRCTIGAVRALHGSADGVALVGFDEFELADVLGVTIVRSDPYRIGAVASQLVFDRMAGDERPPQKVMLPAELIPRGSGERPA